jgi:hypothetical protein
VVPPTEFEPGRQDLGFWPQQSVGDAQATFTTPCYGAKDTFVSTEPDEAFQHAALSCAGRSQPRL